MKRHTIKFLLLVALMVPIGSCNDKLNVPPQGAIDFNNLKNEQGVQGLLIGAYSALDGWFGFGVAAPWGIALSNWLYGDIPAGDADKGGGLGDQGDMRFLEQFKYNPSFPFLNDKWIALYEGVARTNDAIRGIRGSTVGDAEKLELEGEARFLRAFYHFEAKKIWGNVPFVDETIVDFRLANDADIWPKIVADLEYSVANLPVDQSQVGRATQGAAKALLAKVYLFQKNFGAAKPLLEDVLNSPKYGLFANFEDNFRITSKNGKESIFAYQSAVKDGTQDADHANLNANWGDILAHPSFAPYNSPGFQQPTYNLVNAYKTGADGLPMFDTFNDVDINNDVTTSGAFTEYTGNLDPRLDFTVGRKGIPYLGFGDHPGKSGMPNPVEFGPYSNRKNNFNKVEYDAGFYGAGWTNGPSALNYNVIRLADVILWRAEVAVEDNDLDKARQLVNMVRKRAKTGKVLTEDDGVTPAATYVINEYPAGHDAFSSQDKARRAVYYERRLELALEGHRFFDLVRWGVAESYISTYITQEAIRRPAILSGASFDPTKHTVFPIPLIQIQASMIKNTQTLKQNPNY